MYKSKYGEFVEKGENTDFGELLDDFDDLMRGYYDGSSEAPEIIRRMIRCIELRGWKIDDEAEESLLDYVCGYDFNRTRRFRERDEAGCDFVQNVILLLTLSYPNDFPVKKIKKRQERSVVGLEELMAFYPEAEEVFAEEVRHEAHNP